MELIDKSERVHPLPNLSVSDFANARFEIFKRQYEISIFSANGQMFQDVGVDFML